MCLYGIQAVYIFVCASKDKVEVTGPSDISSCNLINFAPRGSGRSNLNKVNEVEGYEHTQTCTHTYTRTLDMKFTSVCAVVSALKTINSRLCCGVFFVANFLLLQREKVTDGDG